VEVRALEDGQSIVIEAADSGVGFLRKICQKFSKSCIVVRMRSTEGSGLGLALVNRIVALHNGRIYVRSSQLEPRGTVFTMRLPVTRRG
jgi:signal transduction histidine kinase